LITDHIRLVAHRGRTLWQHNGRMGWEIEPARFIRRLLHSHGFNKQDAARIMREIQVTEAEPSPIVARLVHNSRVVAYRVATWIGKRFATERQVREWLKWNGFDADEIRSLFIVADTIPVSASEAKAIRKLAEHGIRA
jgi:SOS response regulatory protein OraA/RecX